MAAISAGAIAGAAGLSIAGGVLGSIADSVGQYNVNKKLNQQNYQLNQLLQEDQQIFNAWQADINREREDTKYQRTLADMKAAGINPASIGMTPPSSSGGPMASSGLSSVHSSSSSRTDLGHILSSAFEKALINTLDDNDVSKRLMDRTATTARQVVKKEPAWMKDYVKNFNNDIEDL